MQSLPLMIRGVPYFLTVGATREGAGLRVDLRLRRQQVDPGADSDLEERLGLAAELVWRAFGAAALAWLPRPAKGFTPCRDAIGRFASCGTEGSLGPRSRELIFSSRVANAKGLISSAIQHPGQRTKEHMEELLHSLSRLRAKDLSGLVEHYGGKLQGRWPKADVVEALRLHVESFKPEMPKPPEFRDSTERSGWLSRPATAQEVAAVNDILEGYKAGDAKADALGKIQKSIDRAANRATKMAEEADRLTERFVGEAPNFPPGHETARKYEEEMNLAAAKLMAADDKVAEKLRNRSRDAFKALEVPKAQQADITILPQKSGSRPAGPYVTSLATDAAKWLAPILANRRWQAGYHSLGAGDRPYVPVSVTQIPRDEEQRASYNVGVIDLTHKNDVGTAVHEIGHLLEDNSPGIRRACEAFRELRCAGNPTLNLKQEFPSYDYKPWETTRDDKFLAAFGGDRNEALYAAKNYVGASEILSMGLERLHRDPVAFARADRQYFKFVCACLDGTFK